MRGKRALLLLLSASLSLSGCVAALVPLAAAGALGKLQLDRVKVGKKFVESGAVKVASPVDLAASARGVGTINTAQLDDESQKYLDSIFSRTAAQRSGRFQAFTQYAIDQWIKIEAGQRIPSAVLVPNVDILNPKTVECSGRPPAVIIDLDEQPSDHLSQTDRFFGQQDLAQDIRKLQAAKISIIWLSNEPRSASSDLMKKLQDAGLTAVGTQDFIYLGRGPRDRKQLRRLEAARNYCIVAMAGDERADFDELYDYLRNPEAAIALEAMIGRGWFLIPPAATGTPRIENDAAAGADATTDKG
jgi:hypothetical protein